MTTKTRSGKSHDQEAVRRFVEDFALVFSDAGMQRMPARVFSALLTTQKNGLTAAELAETLQISPAAVSGAVRYLLQVGFIDRAREPGQRIDHYLVGDNTWYETVGRKDPVYLQLIETLHRGIAAVGATSQAGKRLADTRDFFAFLAKEMPLLIERWRKLKEAKS